MSLRFTKMVFYDLNGERGPDSVQSFDSEQ